MRRLSLLLCMLLALSACGSPYDSDGVASDPAPDHSHILIDGNNVLEHEPEGYCGNTITTVRYVPMGEHGAGWERSFWGGISVGLTDFLRWLDYSGEVCRCIPEYYVKTEFSNLEYGINLSEGYVRFEGKQCQLTGEQVRWLQTMLEEIASDNTNDLCALPTAEQKPVFI